MLLSGKHSSRVGDEDSDLPLSRVLPVLGRKSDEIQLKKRPMKKQLILFPSARGNVELGKGPIGLRPPIPR